MNITSNKNIIVDSPCGSCENPGQDTETLTRHMDWKKILTWIAGISFVVGFSLGLANFSDVLGMAFYYISILSGGVYVLKGAWRGLIKQRFLNIDFLVVIATLGAIYLGELPEAAAVIFFFSLAEAFEDYGINRSRRALQGLLEKSPQVATLLDGKVVPIDEVAIGQKVQVKPGEIIPLDGIVIKGMSAVNEATITGESIPKDKREGDAVFAGTLNENGYLEIEITKESKNSTLARIVDLVKQAQKEKPPTQEFIDRFAKYYTPAVVLLALLLSTVMPVITGDPFSMWLIRAVTLLVIACPCALVVSTPVAITSAIGGASKKGILIKSGKYLEELKKVKAVAFDKTGTLTLGEPYISDIVTFNGFTEKQVIEDAAGLEQFSSHPLAKSILSFSKEKGISPHDMENYQSIAGKGGKATCMVCDDMEHCIGNLKLINEHAVSTKEILEKTERFELEGKTVVLVSRGDTVMGALAITDRIRNEAKATIAKLAHLQVETVILTGDNQHTANYVAKKLSIQKAFGSLLPEEKVDQIQALKDKYGSVAMVGDGVNDAPSLALSSVGIAMGTKGSDVAIETADITLMNDDILNIPHIISLSKESLRTVKHNVTAAIVSKLAFIILAIFGVSSLGIAIAADTGVAILVILNGLRLFKN